MRRTVTLALVGLLLLALPGCRSFRQMFQRKMAEAAAKRPPYARVSPAVAYEMIRDNPEMLIVDLRAPQAFNGDTGHIFRSYDIPLNRLPFRLLEISAFREDTFLVYCDTRSCADEGMAILVSSGFENAVLIDGGIDRWIAKGFRTVLPGDKAGRAAEQAANSKGLQPAAGTPPGTAAQDANAPPPPPP